MREEVADDKEICGGLQVRAYLWSRSILCPNCTGLIPLSPTWEISKSQKWGCRLIPNPGFGLVGFEVVSLADVSRGTVKKAIAVCPMCGFTCPKGHPAAEARAGRMDHIHYITVQRDMYPIYRAGKKPIQGKAPLDFVVPGELWYHSWLIRHKTLAAAGIKDALIETDPQLPELGLFGGTETQYAPGVELFGLPPDPWEDENG